METIPVFVAIGAIAAAVIAGSFSFLNLVTSKEQKVSEFRLAWIDSLRSEISNFISAVSFLNISYMAYQERHPEENDIMKFYDSVRDSYEKVTESYSSILLRVNPDEKNSELRQINDAFLNTLKSIRKLFNDVNLKDASAQCDTLREHAIPLLKLEWKRVKDGERPYRWSKYIAAVIVVVGIGGIVTLLMYAHRIETQPKAPVEGTYISKPS